MNVNKIIAWEEGSLTDNETLDLFSELIKNGSAWTLQGCYGRFAQGLIDAGYISTSGKILNYVGGETDENI